jgi:hypothetical protein
MAESTTATTTTKPSASEAPASAPASAAAAVPTVLGPDPEQIAYAEARQKAVAADKAEAEKNKTDPWEDGAAVAQATADNAAARLEPTTQPGGSIDERDVVGGNIKEQVNQPSSGTKRDSTRAERLLVRAAKAAGTQKVAALVGRPITEWGLVGLGDELNGHYVLIDLDSLEKVEVIDRWVINDDRIFANSQQWPKPLVHGDTLERIG